MKDRDAKARLPFQRSGGQWEGEWEKLTFKEVLVHMHRGYTAMYHIHTHNDIGALVPWPGQVSICLDAENTCVHRVLLVINAEDTRDRMA